MKNGRNSSGADSDTRSPSAQRAPPRSESEYLAQQAADARVALTRTLHELGGHVAGALDPRGWTKRFPLPAVGVAAAGGLVATLLARRGLHRSESRVAEKPARPDCPDPQPQPGDSKKNSWIGALAWAGADLLKAAIVTSFKTPSPPAASADAPERNADDVPMT